MRLPSRKLPAVRSDLQEAAPRESRERRLTDEVQCHDQGDRDSTNAVEHGQVAGERRGSGGGGAQ